LLFAISKPAFVFFVSPPKGPAPQFSSSMISSHKRSPPRSIFPFFLFPFRQPTLGPFCLSPPGRKEDSHPAISPYFGTFVGLSFVPPTLPPKTQTVMQTSFPPEIFLRPLNPSLTLFPPRAAAGFFLLFFRVRDDWLSTNHWFGENHLSPSGCKLLLFVNFRSPCTGVPSFFSTKSGVLKHQMSRCLSFFSISFPLSLLVSRFQASPSFVRFFQ